MVAIGIVVAAVRSADPLPCGKRRQAAALQNRKFDSDSDTDSADSAGRPFGSITNFRAPLRGAVFFLGVCPVVPLVPRFTDRLLSAVPPGPRNFRYRDRDRYRYRKTAGGPARRTRIFLATKVRQSLRIWDRKERGDRKDRGGPAPQILRGMGSVISASSAFSAVKIRRIGVSQPRDRNRCRDRSGAG